jgi:hypothetical protein
MVKTKRRAASMPPPKRQKTVSFGPVTAVSSAPVAIGNSIRGTKPVVEMSANGCRVRGRDFGFTMDGTVAAATGWTLVGGMPATPCALPSSGLKAYAQMYSYFKFNSITAHYITSSPTSQAGDVMFYYERDRAGPMVDNTGASFLPYVLSDPNTVLGPQWTNHSALIRPDPEFKSTDYGLNHDLNEEANGSIFIFSKTSAANSPGYVIFDYDITFKQHSVNPRNGVLPDIRLQWWNTCIGQTGIAQTSGTTVLLPVFQGNKTSGTAAAAPTGATTGDVYKIIFDVVNSTVSGVNAAWTNVTSSTLARYNGYQAGTSSAITITDGFTCYGTYNNDGELILFADLENALVGNTPFVAGATSTNTYNICCHVSLVTSIRPLSLQSVL